MMNIIKKGSSGLDVLIIQSHLGITPDGFFGDETENKVKEYQSLKGLVSDGIVGNKTYSTFSVSKISDADFKTLSSKLDVDVASLKAVYSVESGGSGFYTNSLRPKILFEGHIFWKELTKRNIDPTKYQSSHNTILYRNWTKAYYKGGESEYTRIQEAWGINPEAALSSASIGLFQILGNNYALTGSSSVYDYWSKSCISEYNQLKLFGNFIKNSGLLSYLKSHFWADFAKAYNGPSYKKNNYDKKLESAYKKYL